MIIIIIIIIFVKYRSYVLNYIVHYTSLLGVKIFLFDIIM